MNDDKDQTNGQPQPFDFSAFPPEVLIHDRREGRDRRGVGASGRAKPAEKEKPAGRPERREKKERRRRVDPTTFEKQYTSDELEFMNAMQRFKEFSGKPFPTHGEVLRVAAALGYRKVVEDCVGGGEVVGSLVMEHPGGDGLGVEFLGGAGANIRQRT